MEETLKCKNHSKVLDIFCKECKEVICYKCTNYHKEKGCKDIVHLLQYVENDVLPIYKAKLKNLKTNAHSIEDSIKGFLLSGKSIKEELIKLKEELETLLNTINNSLKLFEASENVEEISDRYIEDAFISKYEELKESIEKQDINYIINNLNMSFKLEIGDSERYLVEAIKKSIKNIINSEESNTLSKLLTDLNSKYELCTHRYKYDVRSNFVYGICSPLENCKRLCKYDILKKKLIATVTVPQYCSVIQIADRIFISGGMGPYTNKTSEYIEKTSALVSKSPMKYCKRAHSLQEINREIFTAIGGYNEKLISYCEVYSIPDNKWKPLPSLNNARSCLATLCLNNKFLYAIGGHYNNETIEVLNFNEGKTWKLVSLTSNEIKLSNGPTAIPISRDEVLILCGDNGTDAGIYNISLNSIKKYSCSKLKDYYPYNMISIINKKAYVLGFNGHMHVYNMITKELTELEHSSILPQISVDSLYLRPDLYPFI